MNRMVNELFVNERGYICAWCEWNAGSTTERDDTNWLFVAHSEDDAVPLCGPSCLAQYAAEKVKEGLGAHVHYLLGNLA